MTDWGGAMQWEEFVGTLSRYDRIRLMRSLDEARQYANLASRATRETEVAEVVGYIDRALDALAAARILLRAPAEPQPWANPTYRAYRTHLPSTSLRVRPTELAALQEAARRRHDRPAPVSRERPPA